MKVYDAEPP